VDSDTDRRLEQIEETIAAQARELSDARAAIEQIRSRLSGGGDLSQALIRLQHGVDALLRNAYLEPRALAYPERIVTQRFRLRSQNGEDGMTTALFADIGVATKQFVEIGCGRNGGNSGFLAFELGWSGLMVDADPVAIESIKLRFEGRRVEAVQAWITVETVEDLLVEHACTGELDLLSIDIDGNDYWVWEAITAISPRVVIVEYNALFGPERAVVVPYDPEFDRHECHPSYFGASLGALAKLGAMKGYRLVATEPRGANAFFLRADVGEEIPAVPVAEAYRPIVRQEWDYERPMAPRHVAALRRRTEELYAYVESEGLPLVDV
jgi:hypothetical protein